MPGYSGQGVCYVAPDMNRFHMKMKCKETRSDLQTVAGRRCKMPWFNNPVTTCKVLNKIASRYDQSSLETLKVVLDNATELIWRKQEHYIETANDDRELE